MAEDLCAELQQDIRDYDSAVSYLKDAFLESLGEDNPEPSHKQLDYSKSGGSLPHDQSAHSPLFIHLIDNPMFCSLTPSLLIVLLFQILWEFDFHTGNPLFAPTVHHPSSITPVVFSWP